MIVMDMDGCLADFNWAYLDMLNRVSGKQVVVPDDWEPQEWSYERGLGFTAEEIRSAWDLIADPANNFWAGLSDYPEAGDAVDRLDLLREGGKHIIFLTTRVGTHAKLQTEEWLDDMGYRFPTVIVSGTKGPICAALGATHFLDDRDKNCMEVSQCSPNTKVYLLARPWNRGLQQTASLQGITVVRTVGEYLTQVEADLATV